MIIGIVCYPTFGGSGVLATELGIELSRKGHEIHFITYNQPVKLELFSNKVHFHEVEVPNYPLFHYPPYELALSSRLVGIVKKYKINILHVHYAIPHAYAALMAKQMLDSIGIKIPRSSNESKKEVFKQTKEKLNSVLATKKTPSSFSRISVDEIPHVLLFA